MLDMIGTTLHGIQWLATDGSNFAESMGLVIFFAFILTFMGGGE